MTRSIECLHSIGERDISGWRYPEVSCLATSIRDPTVSTHSRDNFILRQRIIHDSVIARMKRLKSCSQIRKKNFKQKNRNSKKNEKKICIQVSVNDVGEKTKTFPPKLQNQLIRNKTLNLFDDQSRFRRLSIWKVICLKTC